MSGPILVGQDGSVGAAKALDFAMAVAKGCGMPLVVAAVVEWSPYAVGTPDDLAKRHTERKQEIAQAKKELIDPAVAKAKAAGLEAIPVIRHGHAAEVLAKLAKEHKASQVVVGLRGQTKLERLLFGSVAGTLVQISPVPVTVVP